MTMNYNLVPGIRLTTPLAKFQYPKLVEPETKFNPEGVYKLTAVLDAADANDISEALDTLLNNHKASLKAQDPTKKDWKLADLPYSFEDFDGKPSFIVKVKMKAKGAALNAVQIAQLLDEQGMLKTASGYRTLTVG